MKHRVREGAPTVEFYDTPQTASAEWVLDAQGAPANINVPVGTGVVYTPESKVLHLRDERTGWSRTYTPEVIVTIDHSTPYFELEFCDPNNPGRFMPSVGIGNYPFFRADNGQEGYTFSNKAMFETFRAFMASPIYNPFETPIPSLDSTPQDEAYCDVISFKFENDRPLPVWDRHDKEAVLLAPDQHDGRVASWDKETGDPVLIYVRGDNTNGGWIAEGHMKWPAFANEIKLGHVRWDYFVRREPFDPSRFQPRAYHGAVVDKSSLPVENVAMPKGSYSSLDSFLGIMGKVTGKR